jgi:MscS family membrane protein
MDISALDHWLDTLNLGNPLAKGVLHIFIAVAITSTISFFMSKFLVKLEQQFSKTENIWDDTFLWALRKPVTFLIWILGISWAAHIASMYTSAEIFKFVSPLRQVGIIFILTLFIVRFVSGGEKILVSPDKMKQPMDKTSVSAIGKLLRASVIITSVLVVLQTLGYSISGVLAFGGIGGIAVGFAAKDLLANFFGGLMIYFDRPFNVGDWIRSPDKEIEGTVEHIGWRLTTIRTFDKRPLYVPNGTFANISVQNPSRMSHRRILETIGIRYDDGHKMNKIIDDVKAMLVAHPEIDPYQTLIVNFNSFSASSLDFFIYTFTKTTNWIKYHEVKQDVLLKIMQIIEDNGAEIAFPTSTIHIATPSPETAGLEDGSPEIQKNMQEIPK